MPTLNLVCVICDEDFKNSEIIQSTYCGHIFHKNCLDAWKLRRRSCPMCQREFSVSTFDHQLFLTLDDQEVDLEDIKKKLESIKKKNDQLQDQIAEIEFNFLHAQEQFTTSEQSKKYLEQQIKEQISTENNFLELQRQCTESVETVKELKKLIQQINIENEKKTKELDLKCVESSNMTACCLSVSEDTVLKNEVRILEQKLKYVGKQLEEEIANSTRLSVEKMKKESLIEKTKNDLPNLNRENVSKPEHRSSSSNTSNSVIIENFPIEHIKCSLKNLIISLGTKMHLPMRLEDICEARILDKIESPTTSGGMVSFLVKFKAYDMKDKFLLKKNILKDDPITSSCVVRQYEENTKSLSSCIVRQYEENTNPLFIYAKEKLKNYFSAVYCKENRVFAKKHKKSKPLLIFNKNHVDNLLKRDIEVQHLKDSDEKKFKNHEIDENYYQL